MRPCRQCRTPIENQAATCLQCGAVQNEAPRVNTEPNPPRRGIARQFLRDSFRVSGLALVIVCLILALGAGVGYLIGDGIGAGLGMFAGAVTIFGLYVWAEAGADA